MPLVNVTMARGRTTQEKQAMLHAIADAIQESIGAPRDSIRVWITEVESTEFLAGTEILSDKQARLAGERGLSQQSQQQQQQQQ
jgi:4-oxalocrotonate tautomerase